MSRRGRALAARRALLITRSAEQRAAIELELSAWRERAFAVDRLLQTIYRYRALVAVALGITTFFGLRHRRGIFHWGKRLWPVWGLLRALRSARS